MCMEKMKKYFSKHVYFGNTVHVIGGVGIGLLLYPFITGTDTFSIGVALIAVSILGHVYAAVAKK